MLPYLSRYMGHASFDSTYYYIHTSPGFMNAFVLTRAYVVAVTRNEWLDKGSFIVVADGFTLGKGAPDPVEAAAWLRLVGSKQAQEAFDPVKGAIPVRTDVDKSKFGAYLQWSMASFAKDNLVPSCVHGEAAPAAFEQALSGAISLFVADRDVNHLTAALVQAAKDYGIQR